MSGKMKQYPCFKKITVLAELIGIILGDGHIQKFSRTERMVITCNSSDKRYINHIVEIITKVFKKSPAVLKRNYENTIDISLYQCELSKRLEIPAGNKIKNNVGIPAWIKKDKNYSISCLKGLFETDGCFQEDKSNYAQYIELRNLCGKIRTNTYNLLVKLGYNPQISNTYVRLAKKKEVYSFKELIMFREY